MDSMHGIFFAALVILQHWDDWFTPPTAKATWPPTSILASKYGGIPTGNKFTDSTSTSPTASNKYCPYLHTCQAIKPANPSDHLFQHCFCTCDISIYSYSSWNENFIYTKAIMSWPVIWINLSYLKCLLVSIQEAFWLYNWKLLICNFA